MLARLGAVFWEASVDVGPTMRPMRDRSANADFFARLFELETLFEDMKKFSRFCCSRITENAVLCSSCSLRVGLTNRKENRPVGTWGSTIAVLAVATSGIPAASLPVTDARAVVDSIETFCSFVTWFALNKI